MAPLCIRLLAVIDDYQTCKLTTLTTQLYYKLSCMTRHKKCHETFFYILFTLVTWFHWEMRHECYPQLMYKSVKFINGCKANNETYRTANGFRGHNYSCAIDLHNSLMALQANTCLKCHSLWTTSERFSFMAWSNKDVKCMLKVMLKIVGFHLWLLATTRARFTIIIT